jgi:hypothetical protein
MLLKSLDLSFNDIEGEVPVHGVFQNASAVSVSGKKNLFGGILELNLFCPHALPSQSQNLLPS